MNIYFGVLQEEDVLDDPNEMPDEPRFSSQLSEEAQYAMLRGYQDKIQDELTSKSLRKFESCHPLETFKQRKTVSTATSDRNRLSNETDAFDYFDDFSS